MPIISISSKLKKIYETIAHYLTKGYNIQTITLTSTGCRTKQWFRKRRAVVCWVPTWQEVPRLQSKFSSKCKARTHLTVPFRAGLSGTNCGTGTTKRTRSDFGTERPERYQFRNGWHTSNRKLHCNRLLISLLGTHYNCYCSVISSKQINIRCSLSISIRYSRIFIRFRRISVKRSDRIGYPNPIRIRTDFSDIRTALMVIVHRTFSVVGLH
jgi:hypothetical protein